jgi:hypothetical protein
MLPQSRWVDFPAVDAFSSERCLQAGVTPHRSPGANVFRSDLCSLKHGIIGPAGSGVGIAFPQAQFGSL